MIAFITQGLGFGFAAGTSPGPFQSFLISTTLSQGWRRSIIIIFSPLVVDPPIILLMTFLLDQLPGGVLRAIQVAGGLFVLYLAWGTWQSIQKGISLGESNDVDVVEGRAITRRIFRQAAMMNVLSPGPYIFWGSVTGPILIESLEQSLLHTTAFLFAFYGAFLSIMAIIVAIFERVRRIDEQTTKNILMLTVVVLVVLGLGLITQGISG